jgi:hypothetical protein
MNRVLKTALILSLTAIPLASLGATAVSVPDTLDSRAPIPGFVFPAGLEIFYYADVETLRWSIDEQSWGDSPTSIVLTELVEGSDPVQINIPVDPDGQYTYLWQVPPLNYKGDLEARLSLKATDRFGGSRTAYSNWFAIWDEVSPVPAATVRNGLGLARPNPFNPRTTGSYSLSEPAFCRLTVFDVRGRAVANLVDEDRPAGEHKAVWQGRGNDGREVASGTYFALLRLRGSSREESFVTRLTLVK